MTFLAGHRPADVVALGSGLLVLALALIVAQLGFYREGDMRQAGIAGRVRLPDVPSAPLGLKNPQFRTIWEDCLEVTTIPARHMAYRATDQL